MIVESSRITIETQIICFLTEFVYIINIFHSLYFKILILNIFYVKKVPKIVEISHIPLLSFPNVNILHSHHTMIKTNKLTLEQYYEINYRHHQLYTNLFFFFQDPTQISTLHLIFIFPGSF